jgi:hypothetical protein
VDITAGGNFLGLCDKKSSYKHVPRCKWEDNIKMDIQKVGFGGMRWIVLAQDRDRLRALVNAVMNLRVP